MHTTVQKWGNSLGVRLPSIFAKNFSLTNGSSIEIIQENERIIILPPKKSLDQMLQKVTDKNIHSPIDSGSPLGNEEW